MRKFSNIIFLKEQILVKKNEESFQEILIFGNGIHSWALILCMNGYLVGHMNLVAMSKNMMQQLFYWPSHVLYESMASCDIQSVVH